MRRGWLIRKTSFIERLVEKITRPVAGKNSPCAISAVSRRSQPQYKQLRAGVSKAWNRFAPIVTAQKGASFIKRNLFAIEDETRTLPAANNLLV